MREVILPRDVKKLFVRVYSVPRQGVLVSVNLETCAERAGQTRSDVACGLDWDAPFFGWSAKFRERSSTCIVFSAVYCPGNLAQISPSALTSCFHALPSRSL